MNKLRYLMAGMLIGGMLQGLVAQERGIVGLNHVALAVENFDAAVKFYTEVMGFPQAFAFRDASGPVLSYLQISRSTFIELMPVTPERPPGFVHYGLEVADLDAEIRRLQDHGMRLDGPWSVLGPTRAVRTPRHLKVPVLNCSSMAQRLCSDG